MKLGMPIVKRKISRRIPYLLIAVILILLAFAGGAAAFFAVTFNNDRIYSGISVGGQDVGGLTINEATSVITLKVEAALGDKNIDLVYNEKRRSVELTDKVSFDVAAAVQSAYDVGRSGDVATRIIEIVSSKRDIPLACSHDEKYIKEKILSFAQDVEKGSNAITFSDDMKAANIDLDGGAIIDAEGTFAIFAENSKKLVFNDITLLTHTNLKGDVTDLIFSRLNRAPVDATCDIVNNRPLIQDEIVGTKANRDAIDYHIKNGERRFSVEVTPLIPEVTRQKLEESMFGDVLGEYTTKYDESNVGRTKNVKLSAQKINGTVIASGENFSFNGIVGERTYAKGYMDANVYVGGRIEQGVGGGICQVVSTLYSAQLYSDLQTVSRQNHLFTVSYLPLGQDATVAWASIDYIFKNSTKYPIKIIAITEGGRLTIRIMGTKEDKERSVKIINNTISVTAPKERLRYSPDLAAGKVEVEQKGQSGAVVDTYKAYMRNGVEEERIFLHRSVYTAMERIITKSTQISQTNQSAEEGSEAYEPAPTQPADGASPSAAPEPSPSKIPDEFISDNGL